MGYRNRQKTAPSRKIAGYEEGAIKSQLNSLIARHLVASSCPLDAEDLAELYISTMTSSERAAWVAMRQWWANLGPVDQLPLKDGTVTPVLVELSDGVRLVLQLPFDSLEDARIPIWYCKAREFTKPHLVLAADKAKAFDEWCRRSIHTFMRVRASHDMIMSLTNMASTVGQLNRMAPELVKYTPLHTQTALLTQERRSPLPAEWMQVDRMALRATMDHISLCYLLPDPANGSLEIGSVVWSALWPWAGNGMIFSNYNSRPDSELTAQLSSYELPDDPNPVVMGSFILAK